MIVAHRGHWSPARERENSPAAMKAALARGWGVELDLCRQGTAPMVHHVGGPEHALVDVAPVLRAHLAPILWDVKSPGLEDVLFALYEVAPDIAARSLVFDHELVDPELPSRFPTATYLARATSPAEAEAPPAWAAGLWLDQPEADWVTAEVIDAVQKRDLLAYVVSPELHRRPLNLRLWQDWCYADGVCTDHPQLMDAITKGVLPLNPTDPWWQTNA